METKYTVRVVIADDHEFYIDGLKGYFSGNNVYEIVGEAHNGEELLSKVLSLKPHIVLTDLRMPLLSGAKAISKLVREQPKIKCIVLTSYENDYSIVEALEAGAKGYITKSMPKEDLFTALDRVCRGYPYYCLTTNTKLVRLLAKSPFNPYNGKVKLTFRPIEKEVITLLCEQKTSSEIGKELCVSKRTIENIRNALYKKMQVKTLAGLVIYAIKNGLYILDE